MTCLAAIQTLSSDDTGESRPPHSQETDVTLADRLNDLDVDASAVKGQVSLCPQAEKAFDGDVLKPEFAWLDDCDSYLDRGHSDEPFTYYVEYGGDVASWSWSESQWE